MTQLDGLSLLFDDGAPMQAQPVQSPVPRPAPVVRPGEGSRRRQAPRTQPKINGLDLLFDDGPTQAPEQAPAPQQAAPAPQPVPETPPEQRAPMPQFAQPGVFNTPPAEPQPVAPGTPEPDAKTWLGRRVQDVVGKRDPRFADLPEFINTPGAADISSRMLGGKLFAATDAQYADIIAKGLGDKLISRFKDANGYEIVTYRGPDGKPISAYVNSPGLGGEDISRGIYGALPYMAGMGAGSAAGRWVAGKMFTQGAKAVPGVIKAPLIGGLAAGQSVANDIAAENLGSERGVDPGRAVVAGITGTLAVPAAAGVSALWRRFIVEPRFFNRATGELTERGMAEAQRLGIDPADLTEAARREFAASMAGTAGRFEGATRAQGNFAADAATAQSNASVFRVPKTLGERMNAPDQLLLEQRVRGGAYGDSAAARVNEFDARQRQAIANRLLGDVPDQSGVPPIPQRIAMTRTAEESTKAGTGQAIRNSATAAREFARAEERAAWQGVRDVTAPPQALARLPEYINRNIADFSIDDVGTPAAARMMRALDDFYQGNAPQRVASFQGVDPVGRVDAMRRRIGKMLTGAQTPEDRAAARAIYQGYGDWLRGASDDLMSANPNAAAELRTAIGLSREVKEMFVGQRGSSGSTILDRILSDTKTDSAEGVVNALFTGPTAEIKGGTMQALTSLRRAYDRFLPPEQAAAAWNDIRLAYWLRIASKNGEPVGVAQFLSNMARAMDKQASVMRLLYSPREISLMQRLASELRGIENKNLNRSWTAPSVSGFMREMTGNIIRALGLNSTIAQTVAGPALRPFTNAYGNQVASRAISQEIARPPANALIAPAITGATVPQIAGD